MSVKFELSYRAVVGGLAGAMAGLVLDLTKQFIGLEVYSYNLQNYIAAYASNLLVHYVEFYSALSYNKSLFF